MFEKVRDIIVDSLNCGEEEVTLEANLIDDLGADSLDIVELNLALEEQLGTAIPDDKIAEIKTVGDVVAFLEANE